MGGLGLRKTGEMKNFRVLVPFFPTSRTFSVYSTQKESLASVPGAAEEDRPWSEEAVSFLVRSVACFFPSAHDDSIYRTPTAERYACGEIVLADFDET